MCCQQVLGGRSQAADPMDSPVALDPLLADPAEQEALKRAIFANSGVKPALTTAQYARRILLLRSEVVDFLLQGVARRDYRALSNNLVLAPVDDMRQACFFLPWALLEEDRVAEGLRCQLAYNELLSSLKAFDSTLLAAARYQVEEDLVGVALRDFVLRLDRFIATIPKEYRV